MMATHGRSGVARAVLGSVATATIRQTDVPIMLVRPDEVEQAPETSRAESPSVVEPPSTMEQGTAGSTITLSLSADDLAMLERAVDDRFSNEPVDPRSAEPVRRLREKLRAARAGSTE